MESGNLLYRDSNMGKFYIEIIIWVVVRIMFSFWVPYILGAVL